MSGRSSEKTVETIIGLLVSDNSLETQWEAVEHLAALVASPWPGEPRSRDVSCSLRLLSHLEKLTLGSGGHPPELARAVAKIIINVTHYGWKWSLTEKDEQTGSFQALCSPLIVKTEDPTMLTALCCLLTKYVDSMTARDQWKVALSPEVTLLDRVLELFLHPNCSIRDAATGLLRSLVENDVSKDYSFIVEPILQRSREALTSPQGLSRCNLCSIIRVLAANYPASIQTIIDGGLVDDMLLLLSSYKYSRIANTPFSNWLDAREGILEALHSVVSHSTGYQIHQLVLAGIIPTLLEWIAVVGVDSEWFSVAILNIVFGHGERMQICRGLLDNPYAGPYRDFLTDSFWNAIDPDDEDMDEIRHFLYTPKNLLSVFLVVDSDC